jgi:hypothetical protein
LRLRAKQDEQRRVPAAASGRQRRHPGAATAWPWAAGARTATYKNLTATLFLLSF